MACLQPVPVLAVVGVDMGVVVASVDGVVVVVEVREGGREALASSKVAVERLSGFEMTGERK
jgi:hypothetical protein